MHHQSDDCLHCLTDGLLPAPFQFPSAAGWLAVVVDDDDHERDEQAIGTTSPLLLLLCRCGCLVIFLATGNYQFRLLCLARPCEDCVGS